MSKRQQRAHRASYLVLIVHLMKWQDQAVRRSRSWAATIARERTNIVERERRSKGLQQMAIDNLPLTYAAARRHAALETGVALQAVPTKCPYTIEFLRDHDAMPE